MLKPRDRSVGVAVVGLGGGVATAAAAGVELIRRGLAGLDGLPLVETPESAGLAPYGALAFAGWDVSGADLATAARHHGVVPEGKLDAVADRLAARTPWPAAADLDYCRNITGANLYHDTTKRALAGRLAADLRRFAGELGHDRIVVINLASTERVPDIAAPCLQDAAAFEAGLDANDPAISPSMLYAYAAITEGKPYGNFTPNIAAEVPALVELAARHGVPLAGRDGKTGQTMMKTVLAPAFRARALTVEGWYSTNILGNRDGQALDDPASLASKIGTKGDVLGQMLGYDVANHIVQISYYPPRGDDKEAWDNIDLTGFLGERMQVKVNFLCKDSILAAPLVIEIARCLDLAGRRGEAGPVEALSGFFKAPMAVDGPPVHGFAAQQMALMRWLDRRAPEDAAAGDAPATVPAQ